MWRFDLGGHKLPHRIASMPTALLVRIELEWRWTCCNAQQGCKASSKTEPHRLTGCQKLKWKRFRHDRTFLLGPNRLAGGTLPRNKQIDRNFWSKSTTTHSDSSYSFFFVGRKWMTWHSPVDLPLLFSVVHNRCQSRSTTICRQLSGAEHRKKIDGWSRLWAAKSRLAKFSFSSDSLGNFHGFRTSLALLLLSRAGSSSHLILLHDSSAYLVHYPNMKPHLL